MGVGEGPGVNSLQPPPPLHLAAPLVHPYHQSTPSPQRSTSARPGPWPRAPQGPLAPIAGAATAAARTRPQRHAQQQVEGDGAPHHLQQEGGGGVTFITS